jgi:hypothetical protein
MHMLFLIESCLVALPGQVAKPDAWSITPDKGCMHTMDILPYGKLKTMKARKGFNVSINVYTSA